MRYESLSMFSSQFPYDTDLEQAEKSLHEGDYLQAASHYFDALVAGSRKAEKIFAISGPDTARFEYFFGERNEEERRTYRFGNFPLPVSSSFQCNGDPENDFKVALYHLLYLGWDAGKQIAFEILRDLENIATGDLRSKIYFLLGELCAVEDAITYYRNAQNYAPALYNLAIIYRACWHDPHFAKICHIDNAEELTIDCFQRAAAQNHALACYQMAYFAKQQDPDAAFDYYLKSANLGCPEASMELRDHYFKLGNFHRGYYWNKIYDTQIQFEQESEDAAIDFHLRLSHSLPKSSKKFIMSLRDNNPGNLCGAIQQALDTREKEAICDGIVLELTQPAMRLATPSSLRELLQLLQPSHPSGLFNQLTETAKASVAIELISSVNENRFEYDEKLVLFKALQGISNELLLALSDDKFNR